MSSDAKQKEALIDASESLNESMTLREDLTNLSRRLYEIENDEVFETLPVSLRESYQKCIDRIHLLIDKFSVVVTRVETRQEEQSLNESVTELNGIVAGITESLNGVKSRNQEGMRIFGAFGILVVIEAVVWFIWRFSEMGEETLQSPSNLFILFTFALLPQVLLVNIVLLLRIGKQISVSWNSRFYKGKHV